MSRTLKLWLATLVVLAAYLAAAWRVARLLTVPGSERQVLLWGLWVIGVVAAAAVLWFRRPAPAPPRPVDDVDTLLDATARTLAASRIVDAAGRRPSIAALPTIVVLGPEASVKTTAVMHSGLEPELLAGAVQQDGVVAPTTAVNVWYARGTLLIEAGPPVVGAADRWARLVRRLQPDRRAAVLGRGAAAARVALVCCSCEEFLRPGGTEAVEGAARTLRTRLGELSQQLGVALPVYVLFTKLDRVPFFAEYVQQFTREESLEVLGATLPLADGGEVGLYAEREARRVEGAFARLYGSLADRRTGVLAREHAEERRWGAYEFPREFRKLTAPATRFLVELCRPSQLGVSPFLRGFYFSGVQAVTVHEAAPAMVHAPAAAQRVTAHASDATGVFRAVGSPGGEPPWASRSTAPSLTPPRRVPRWMFLGRLFDEVLLADAAAAAVTGGGTRVQLARRLLGAGAAAAALLLGIGITTSYLNNRALARETREAVRSVAALPPVPTTASGPPSVEALRALDTLRTRVATLAEHEREGVPLGLAWGLYAGEPLYEPVRRVYFEALDAQGLGRVREEIVAQLRALPDTAAADRYAPTYELLKTHLITTEQFRRSDSAFLVPVLARTWGAGAGADERATLLRRQLAYYGAELAGGRNPYPGAADALAVQRARAYLNDFVAGDRIYAFVLARAGAGLPPASLARRFPRAVGAVRDPYEVPGAFTAAGWPRVQHALDSVQQYLAGERWVVGEPVGPAPDVGRLRAELRARYARDYAAQWRAYVRAARVAGYGNAADAARGLGVLSGPGSPLLLTLSLAAQHTNVNDARVKQTFSAVHAVTPPTDTVRRRADGAEPYLQGLVALQAAVEQYAKAPLGQREPAAAGVSMAADAAKNAARTLAGTFVADAEGGIDVTVRDLLLAPIVSAEQLTRGAAPGDLAVAGGKLCQSLAPLTGKYPLVPRATVDANPRDVVALLHPQNGSLWAEVEQGLGRSVARQGAQWGAVAGGPPVTREFLGFLNRASLLSAGLFPDGGPVPRLPLTFTQSTIPAGARYVRIFVNGQRHRFDNASRDLKPFGTVTMTTSGQATLDVEYRDGKVAVLAKHTGPWALLKLLRDAETWRDAAGGGYQATWTGPGPTGAPVSVTLSFSLGDGPAVMRADVLGGVVRCPSAVAQ